MYRILFKKIKKYSYDCNFFIYLCPHKLYKPAAVNTLKIDIIKYLYFSGIQSVAEISLSTSKSIPVITKTINELVVTQILIPSGYAPSTGGRRPLQFRLNHEKLPLIMAVAIDQYYTTISLYDLANNPLHELKTIRNPLAKGDAAADAIVGLIREHLSLYPDRPIHAIGITMPGFVDVESGFNNSYSAQDKLYSLRTLIEQEFGIQTLIENDSSAIAIAEKNFGQARASKDVLVVNLNWGVGLGMIIDNKLYRGHSGYAGEFSHIPLSDTQRLCSCGKKGCLEVEASLSAAIEYLLDKLQQGENSALSPMYSEQGFITGEQLMNAANAGDQLAIESVNNIAFMLGKGIATLIHIINPEYVVTSGRGARLGKILLPQIQSALLKYSITRLSKNTTIIISDMEYIQLLGSACIAMGNADWKKLELTNTLLTN